MSAGTVDHEARWKAAATAQGLDPLTARLTAAGIDNGIAQTGGMCMVATVPTPTGTWATIYDGEPGRETTAPAWIVEFFPGDTFETGAEPHTLGTILTDLNGAVSILTDAATKAPQA